MKDQIYLIFRRKNRQKSCLSIMADTLILMDRVKLKQHIKKMKRKKMLKNKFISIGKFYLNSLNRKRKNGKKHV